MWFLLWQFSKNILWHLMLLPGGQPFQSKFGRLCIVSKRATKWRHLDWSLTLQNVINMYQVLPPKKKSKPLAFQPSFWFFTWLWKTDFVDLLHILRVTKTAKTQPTQPTAKWQSQGWSDQPRLPGCAWEIARPTNCRIHCGRLYANPPGSRSNMTCFSTNYGDKDVPRVYNRYQVSCRYLPMLGCLIIWFNS